MSLKSETIEALQLSAQIVHGQVDWLHSHNGNGSTDPGQIQGYENLSKVLEHVGTLKFQDIPYEAARVVNGTLGDVKPTRLELCKVIFDPKGQSIVDLAISAIRCGNVDLLEQLFERQGKYEGVLQLRDIDDARAAAEQTAKQPAGSAGWPFR